MAKTKQSASLGPTSTYAGRTPFDESVPENDLELEARVVNIETAVNAVLLKLNEVSQQLESLITTTQQKKVTVAAIGVGTVKEKLQALLCGGEKKRSELVYAIYGSDATKDKAKYVGQKLKSLCEAGKVKRTRPGFYQLAAQNDFGETAGKANTPPAA